MRSPLILCAALLILMLTPGPTRAQRFQSSAGPLRVETFARGLVHPWALAFLPDGRLLVTERPGRMQAGATAAFLLHQANRLAAAMRGRRADTA